MFLNESIYDILDYTDTNGNKIKKKRMNISFPVLNNKIETGEVLDTIDHVYINGLYETGIQNEIKESSYFKVNYNTGTIFVHSSQEGKTLNLTYTAKAQIRYKAKNTILEDLDDNFIGETVEDALKESAERINNLVLNTSNPAEVTDGHLDGVYNVTDTTLKQGLDRRSQMIKDLQDDLGDISTQISNKANQSDLDTTNANVNNNTTILSRKADKSYVDTQIQSVASGSPKGTYATITDLTNAFPTGNTNIYVVTADGNWYYWKGSAWVSGGIYQSTGIANGSITVSKTDFMTVGINKLDLTTVTKDYYVDNGNVIAYSGWSLSDYISVSYGNTYAFRVFENNSWIDVGNVYLSFYDSNKNYLSSSIGKAVKDVVVPNGACFIRISQATAYFTDAEYPMFGLTSDLSNLSKSSDYTPYGLLVNNLLLNNSSQYVNILNQVNSLNSKSNNINYDKTVKGINRIGYKETGAPENSMIAYKLAKQQGFNYVLCDISYTSDGVCVLLHDQSINRVATNPDGSAIATTVNIDSITYSQAQNYDFGIGYGSQYAGLKIPTFEQLLILAKQLGLNIYVEFKFNCTQANIESSVALAKKYGMIDKISWTGMDITQLSYVQGKYSKARLGWSQGQIPSDFITQLQPILNKGGDVFLFNWNTTTLTPSLVQTMVDNNIAYEIGTLNTVSDVVSYFTGDYWYCSGVESDSLVVGKVLYDNNISV